MPVDASQQPDGNVWQPGFATYADYIDRVGSTADPAYQNYGSLLKNRLQYFRGEHPEVYSGDINLVRFYNDGKPSLVHRFKETRSPDEFRTLLAASDKNAAYQVIILELGNGRLPPAWVVDMIGLGLDMEPEVWVYFWSQEGKWNEVGTAWMNRSDVIEVAALFLANPDGSTPYARMYPPESPSSLQKKKPSQASESNGQSYEKMKTRAVRRWILNAARDSVNIGPKNVLFPCLEALLRWQMCTAPQAVPALTGLAGLNEFVKEKYQHQRRWDGTPEDFNPGIVWHRLR
ncbi:uncharacterized protein EI97DRAFT_455567 [Westerdykella ornata]|uniref:Uncharacterized protein n=1 Tax=Westerdykella ornata TaxID=318751 RepID=A0A6A6JU86_WESOR|nr:uncharacterized protein EI97DRAFT_455567 [Westerdykella ornata]KAF2279306.1 hypothetical protein EI97DRAFT_455567 [Westerdykella ornata]